MCRAALSERQCQWPGPGAPARGGTSADMIAGRYHPNLTRKPSPPGCLTCHWSASERPGHWHWQVTYHWQVSLRSESESLAGILLGQDLRVRYHFTYYSARI